MKQRPKVEYPCGCLIHINGPDDFASICRHYCKEHGATLKEMQKTVSALKAKAQERERAA